MIDLTGYSIQDVMGMSYEELDSLDKKDLATVVSRLTSAANKRVRSLNKRDLPLSLKSMEQGKFSVKGKNKQQLLDEFQRASDFLTKKKTLVRNYKKWRSNVEENILKGLDKENEEEFWELYKKLIYEGDIFEKFKYETFNEIRTSYEENKMPTEKSVAKDILKHLLDTESIDQEKYNKLIDSVEKSNVLDFDYFD